MATKSLAACLAVAAATLCLTPAASRGTDTVTQLWPELEAYRRLNQDARLLFSISPVCEVSGAGLRSNIDDTDFGMDLDTGLFPIGRARLEKARFDADRMHYLRFRTGIHYLNVNEDAANDEWRIIAELTPRTHLPAEMTLAFRNRFDFRWIDDVYSWRYRPRLQLEREFKAWTHMAFVPYASAELFWDSRSERWTRTLYKVGTGIAVRPWFGPQIYWAHQIDDGASGDTITNAIGIELTFHI